jgi:hypothetical protein
MDNDHAELIGAYNTSIVRFNEIAARGSLDSAHIAHGCRVELKTTLRIARQLVAATRNDPELHPCYVGMLKALKRMHYNLLQVEACTVELAIRHN